MDRALTITSIEDIQKLLTDLKDGRLYQITIKLNQWAFKLPNDVIWDELTKLAGIRKADIVFSTRSLLSTAGDPDKQMLIGYVREAAMKEKLLRVGKFKIRDNELEVFGPIDCVMAEDRPKVLVANGLSLEMMIPFIDMLRNYAEFDDNDVTPSVNGNLSVILKNITSLPAGDFRLSNGDGYKAVSIKYHIDGLTQEELLNLEAKPIVPAKENHAKGVWGAPIDYKKKFVSRCYRCNTYGHVRQNCPKIRKNQLTGCSNCGEVGHAAKYCTKPQVCRDCKEPGHFSGDLRCKNPAPVTAAGLVRNNFGERKSRNGKRKNERKSRPQQPKNPFAPSVDIRPPEDFLSNNSRKKTRWSDREDKSGNFYKGTDQEASTSKLTHPELLKIQQSKTTWYNIFQEYKDDYDVTIFAQSILDELSEKAADLERQANLDKNAKIQLDMIQQQKRNAEHNQLLKNSSNNNNQNIPPIIVEDDEEQKDEENKSNDQNNSDGNSMKDNDDESGTESTIQPLNVTMVEKDQSINDENTNMNTGTGEQEMGDENNDTISKQDLDQDLKNADEEQNNMGEEEDKDENTALKLGSKVSEGKEHNSTDELLNESAFGPNPEGDNFNINVPLVITTPSSPYPSGASFKNHLSAIQQQAREQSSRQDVHTQNMYETPNVSNILDTPKNPGRQKNSYMQRRRLSNDMSFSSTPVSMQEKVKPFSKPSYNGLSESRSQEIMQQELFKQKSESLHKSTVKLTNDISALKNLVNGHGSKSSTSEK